MKDTRIRAILPMLTKTIHIQEKKKYIESKNVRRSINSLKYTNE